jgi:DNA replication protein DnaC
LPIDKAGADLLFQVISLRYEQGAIVLTSNRAFNSILKFFQVDIAGILRMTSSARYFKEGVGSSRPH